jgi:alpha-D-xyloside xylohydrolase
VEKQVQDIANLRMQLIPYLYTSYADYAFYGNPPIKAMNLVPGFTDANITVKGTLNSVDNPYVKAIRSEIKDQFMVGDDLLVAPLFTGQQTREVVLPLGKWYDFYTGKYAGEGEVLTITPGLDIIPVYVRDGGIVPMTAPIQRIGKEKLPLEIRHYGHKESSYQLYDDDGVSFDYEKGKFTRITLSAKKDKAGMMQGKVSIPAGAAVWSYSNYTWHFMTN